MRRYVLWLISLLALCANPINAATETKPGFTQHYKSSFTRYLDRANHSQPPQSDAFRLQAAGRLLQDHQLNQAEELLKTIPYASLSKPLHDEYLLIESNFHLLNNQPYHSLHTLQQITEPDALLGPQQIAYYSLLAMVNKQIKHYAASTDARIRLDAFLDKNSTYQSQNREQIWDTLNQLSTNELALQIRHATYDDLAGWLSLAYLYRMYHDEPSLLDSEQQQWKAHYPNHPAAYLLAPEQPTTPRRGFLRPRPIVSVNRGNQPLHIALLLPNKGPYAAAAEAIQSGFMSHYENHPGPKDKPADITVYNTVDQDIQAIYDQAIQHGANVVVGPLIKQEVARIEAMHTIPVPTLGLNFTPHRGKGMTNFFEYALSPQDEARQVAEKIRANGLSRALIIAPTGDWGTEVSHAFTQVFRSQNGQIIDTARYEPHGSLDLTIKHLLKINDKAFNQFRQSQPDDYERIEPRRMDFDVIFIVADPMSGRQIKPLLQFYFAENIPVYSTSDIYSGTPNPSLDRDLNGIIFCDMPFNIIKNQRILNAHEQLRHLMPKRTPNKQKLFAFGQDAYLIAIHLNPFKFPASEELDGLTGRLHLKNQQVLRRLTWATFKKGIPVRLDS